MLMHRITKTTSLAKGFLAFDGPKWNKGLEVNDSELTPGIGRCYAGGLPLCRRH